MYIFFLRSVPYNLCNIVCIPMPRMCFAYTQHTAIRATDITHVKYCYGIEMIVPAFRMPKDNVPMKYGSCEIGMVTLSTGHVEQHTGNDTKCDEKQRYTEFGSAGRHGVNCMNGGRAREISGLAIKMFMCNRNDNVCFYHWNDHSNFRRWLLHKYTKYMVRKLKYTHTQADSANTNTYKNSHADG